MIARAGMNFTQLSHTWVLTVVFGISLMGCGGDSSSKMPEPPIITEPSEGIPSNNISYAYFRDQDNQQGMISGIIHITENPITNTSLSDTQSIWLYWADMQGNKLVGVDGEAWMKTTQSTLYNMTIAENTQIPANARALLIMPVNAAGEAEQGTLIKFHDFTGNAQLSGPGGNWEADWSWYYGEQPAEQIPQLSQQREKIAIHKTNNGQCIFDNGLVSVIDMDYERDATWEDRAVPTQSNVADDNLYAPYEFSCAENPVNTHRIVMDDNEESLLWTYSTINDAMFYGTAIHDTFMKYLGEPPLEEKIRVRVHYGGKYFTGIRSQAAYWDGTYANFGDGYPFETSMLTFDVFAHEVGHGVLNRLMNLGYLQTDMSTDVKTLHEAFGDISGVVAWYELTGDSENYWSHGYENGGDGRNVKGIRSSYNSIPSYIDYQPEDPNVYHRIGMISHPFYLMTQQWGIESAYRVYINSAKNCWQATHNLVDIAQCIKQQAGLFAQSGHILSKQQVSEGNTLTKTEAESDVEIAFKAVKIKLFNEGVLSHFNLPEIVIPASQLTVQFADDSRSTGTVNQWLWDFGDGTTSSEKNPSHTYSEAKTYTVTLTVKNTEYAQEASNAVYHKDEFSRKVKVLATES